MKFLAFTAALLAATPALAQEDPGPGPTPTPGDGPSPDELLEEIGANLPQAEIGRVIGVICPSGRITSADLQARCDELIGAAFEQLIPESQAALQAMAPEENGAVGSSLVDASVQQIDRVGQRMESVRAGARGGVSFNLALAGPTAASPPWLRSFAGTPPHGSGFSAQGAAPAPFDTPFDTPFATPFPGLVSAQTGGEGGGGEGGGGGGASYDDAYDDMGARWGLFFSGSLQTAERDSTSREAGFDLDGYGFTAGFDRSGARSTYGLSVGFQNEESDLKQDSGAIDSDSVEASVHASWFPDDQLFVSLVAGAGQGDLEQDRRIVYTLLGTSIDQTARGETDFDQRFANLALGWDLGGPGGGTSAWQVSPEIRAEWLEVDVDPFSEVMSDPTAPGSGLGLEVDGQSFTSLTSNLGVQVARAVSTSWGVLQPSFAAEWVHEFENGVELLTGRFLGDPTDETYVLLSDEAVEDYGRVAASLVAVTAGGGSFYVQVQHLVAYDELESTSFSLGGRLEF